MCVAELTHAPVSPGHCTFCTSEHHTRKLRQILLGVAMFLGISASLTYVRTGTDPRLKNIFLFIPQTF